MKNILLTVIYSLAILVFVNSCEHEPFPPEPNGSSGDTSDVPPQSTYKPCDPDTIYYSRDIQPIFDGNCISCHYSNSNVEIQLCNNDEKETDLNLTSYTSIDFDIIDLDDPTNSKLYKSIAIRTDSCDKRMPLLAGKLKQSDIDKILKWIEQGAEDLSCDECDTVDITYNNTIEEIFKSCTGSPCHHNGPSPAANLDLTTHENVKNAILSTNLIDRINHNVPPGDEMPKNGNKLNDCYLKQINIWVENTMP